MIAILYSFVAMHEGVIFTIIYAYGSAQVAFQSSTRFLLLILWLLTISLSCILLSHSSRLVEDREVMVLCAPYFFRKGVNNGKPSSRMPFLFIY